MYDDGMNTLKLLLISFFVVTNAFAQVDQISSQSPIMTRLDYVESNLSQVANNEQALMAQNQALASKIDAVSNMQAQPAIVASNDLVFLVILSSLIMMLVLAGCMDRQTPTPKEVLIKKQPVKSKKTQMPELVREKHDEEYDFMGSQEAVPARFNLAEAYMQMREFQQARRVLEGILEQGDSDQRQKASALLTQLPSL